jgi:hypothetical protein
MPSDNAAFIHAKTGNIVTPKGRILWNALFTPRKAKGSEDSKFEFNLLIPKGSDVKVLREAAIDAGKEKFAKAFKEAEGKWPKGIATPFKPTEGNDKLVAALEAENIKVEDYPFYFAARSKDKPGVVGPNGKADGVEPEHVYAGRWARATVQAYGYDKAGNKGVSLGLINVQLLDNDDELVVGGGRVNAESEFEAVEAVEGAGSEGGSSDSMFS